jgi:hypothetical protein
MKPETIANTLSFLFLITVVCLTAVEAFHRNVPAVLQIDLAELRMKHSELSWDAGFIVGSHACSNTLYDIRWSKDLITNYCTTNYPKNH